MSEETEGQMELKLGGKVPEGEVLLAWLSKRSFEWERQPADSPTGTLRLKDFGTPPEFIKGSLRDAARAARESRGG